MGFFGGVMLTANVVSQWINNARTKKDIQRVYNDAAEANYKSRAVFALPYLNKVQLLLTTVDSTDIDNDVYKYESGSKTPALDYLWGEHENPESVLVSGGRQEERNRAMMPFLCKAQNEGIPVVALHSDNNDLETLIKGYGFTHEFISQNGYYYDAFRSLPVDDIVFLLYETMPGKITSPNAEALIRSLVEMLLRTEGNVTFHGLATFPLANLMDKLNKLKVDSEVTNDEFNEISSYYMAGSSEVAAVRIYLNKLNRQAENIFGNITSDLCNIKKMLNIKGIVSINTGIGNNDLILTFIINQFLYYQSVGRNFAVMVDNVSLSKFTSLCELIRGRIYAISHEDFVSSLHGGDKKSDDIFAEITGGVSNVVLFNHKSGTSCQKWSEHLGKYHKIKIKMNISQTKSFAMGGNTRGISVEEADEPRVRSETISMLPDSLACIHNRNGTLFAEI